MGHKRLASSVLVVLSVAGIAGVSAFVPGTGSAPGTYVHDARGIAQETPGWQQVNSNGFGDPQAVEVSSLEVLNGRLYAGTSNPTHGARIFRSSDGVTWTPVTQPGFGISHDSAPPSILDLTVFNGQLYASTGRGDGPGQIWRAPDGVTWAPMVINGFGDPDTVDITALATYDGKLYAGVTNLISGAQVWRSYSGDSGSWTQVAPGAPGTTVAGVTGLAVFDGALYAAVESDAPAQIWRGSGISWTVVISDGFGNSLTTSTGGMAEYAGYLYVGAGNTADGALLWRTSDGANWEQAISPAFGDPNNQKVELVFVFQNRLYVSARNVQTGIELWRSTDGVMWERANQNGFGDGSNSGSNRGNATADFLGHLYVGTSNIVDGGELWQMQQRRTHLPLILR